MTDVPLDRNIALDLVRVTEAAALAASRWMGRGDKEGADGAAVDAMRLALRTVSMDGTVIIGEGEKDEAPMLYNGERIGDGSPPECDIAVDPIDGTTLTSKGRGNALAVIALSEKGSMFDPGPCVYMDKLAVGPELVGMCSIELSATEQSKSCRQSAFVSALGGYRCCRHCGRCDRRQGSFLRRFRRRQRSGGREQPRSPDSCRHLAAATSFVSVNSQSQHRRHYASDDSQR